MKISVVIPAYNEELYIGDCLDSVKKNCGNRIHEIIVINNASTDRTREVAMSKGVRVVDELKKGLTSARERGLKEATGNYIAYIDSDTRVPIDWIDKIEKFFVKNPNAVSLSGPYKYYDGSFSNNFFMNIMWYVSAPISYRMVGYMLLGGNFIAKKEALLSAGGFDQSIAFYGEDTDIARRLSKFGKVVFRMDFFIYSSCRRLKKEGLFMTNIRYALNFIWEVIFHRPFTKSYNDIRIKND